MLVIRKLHREFPRRVVEWGMSYILISWGTVVLLTPGQFDMALEGAYQGWRSLAPQYVWGFCALTVGMIRLSAIYINGAHVRSPIARTVAGFFSMLVWFFVVLGLLKGSGPITTGFAVYPWLMVADAYAIYTSSGDAYQSLETHKKSLEYARA